MFSLESSSRYFMCQHPVNMRKGIDSLFSLIQSESPLSPMSGDVFVFFYSDDVYPGSSDSRFIGSSVRLITESK